MSLRRPALAFIFITVLLDMLALGIVIPVLPKLVERLAAGDTARAAEVYGVFGTAWALMQFLAMPVLGVLSDRYGRRPVILLSCLGLGLDHVLMALAPNLAWLFVGRVISGITAANISTSYAYIADVTEPKDRAGAFGIVGMAFGVGFVLGPAVGGLLGGFDPRLPFWVAAGLSLSNALYGWFVLPESLPPERRGAFSWAKANPVGALALLRSQPQLLGLATANFLAQLAHVVLPSVTVLYAGYRYGWDETAVGLMLAGVGVCSMIVQGGLVRPAVARFGERRALLSGLAFGLAGFVIYGAASTGSVFLIGVPVMALWGLTSPAVQALMTRRVGATEQGRLQGATASLQAIAGLVGPGLFTQTFAASIGPRADLHLPGAPFYVAALLLGASLVVGWRATAANARGS
jgi:DHA1 family tetracycline resistance protein-like MFS transporter